MHIKHSDIDPSPVINQYCFPGPMESRGPYHKPVFIPPDYELSENLPDSLGFSGPEESITPNSAFGKRAARLDSIKEQINGLSKEEREAKRYGVLSSGKVIYLSAADILQHIEHETPLGLQFSRLLTT